MNIYQCGRDETLEEALENINEHDKDGKKYTFDKEEDRCYIGDEKFASAPVIINHRNMYWALREI